MKSVIKFLLPAGVMCTLLVILVGCKPEELGKAHPTTDEFYDPPGTVVAEPRMPVAMKRTPAEITANSQGCLNCHKGIHSDDPKKDLDNPSMHLTNVSIGCTDCHGGNANCTVKELAHVQPRGHWYAQTPSETPKRKALKLPGQTPIKKAATANVSADKKAETPSKDGKETEQPASEEEEGGASSPERNEGTANIAGFHGEHHESAANPRRSGSAWEMESPEFVRFVNPGDLRVAKYACGGCHVGYAEKSSHSMMAHGAMLWNAALYNNGASNQKVARFGEAYTYDGEPARLITKGWTEDMAARGVLPFLDPLPRYNITQAGNVLRAFERGGKSKPETASTNKESDPGKPEMKLSIRGYGTNLSTDPVFLGLQKTRLMDPTLWHLGTNDQAGDYRSSGCTACHTVYANDRDPSHSGPYAAYGKDGQTFSNDSAMREIRGKENGHPIRHILTRSIPSSQCIVCHMHPGTTVTMTYYGNLWYDNETEGSKLYPSCQPKKTERDQVRIKARNPEGAALRGKWGDVDFLESVADRNSEFKLVQFADYNGHGWMYRNVYKRDKKGNLLDKDNNLVKWDSPDVFKKGCNGEPIANSAVHMQDIHQEKGMHCIDCHFSQDSHGDGNLYGEVRNAVEITCQDCHGSIRQRAFEKYVFTKGPEKGNAALFSTGNAAPAKKKNPETKQEAEFAGTNLSDSKVKPEGGSSDPRFEVQGGVLIQRSAIYAKKYWVVKQVKDTITPGHPDYNPLSARAKTMQTDAKTWGDIPSDPTLLAHKDDKMDCYTCHTSWVASCFGCHLPMRANQAKFNNHYEGAKSRNWTQYNFQTLREDVFMLGLDGKVKGNKVTPVRSTCAVIVASQNANRDWIYSQQQTISAEGFSGQAFSPHFPHSVRAKETKNCTDCHISKNGDNNAQMAQLLMQGTNQTNFMFRYVYTANGDGGLSATVVTERDEPQAVIGSTLHRDAYPEEYAKHLKDNRMLQEGDHHSGNVLSVQLRGEYVYAAKGKSGMMVYDVANIDNKDFSERIVTAPVSPLGQRFFVKSKNCTSVVSPTVLGVDPTRQEPLRPRDPKNLEQGISLTYAFLYCTDCEEGLFTVMAATLLDGDPSDNYLHRHLTFNPGGILNGAVSATVAGNYIYVCCDAGLVVVDISGIGGELLEAAKCLNPDGTKVLTVKQLEKKAAPADPNCLKVVGVIPMNKPKAVRIQFRYAFVVDCDGMKVVDVTEPTAARLVDGAFVPFASANNIYLSRTYAYVAAGNQGIGIVDIEKAEQPVLDQLFNGEGQLCDVRDVKVGMTNTSLFAYAADASGKLAVIQLTSPETDPNSAGWTPKPNPVLIAVRKLPGTPLMISEGLQRDRGVDESGNQLSVFNRVGSRPFNKAEADRLYKINGSVFTVTTKIEKEDAPKPFTFKLKPDDAPFTISDDMKKDIDKARLEVDSTCEDKKRLEKMDDLVKLYKKMWESQGSVGEDPKVAELKKKIKDLEADLKAAGSNKERNDLKKEIKAKQEELDKLMKAGGGEQKQKADQLKKEIKDLEADLKAAGSAKEQNEIKKKIKAKQAELDESLKSVDKK